MRSARAPVQPPTWTPCGCMKCGCEPEAAGPGSCCGSWGCCRRRRGGGRTEATSVLAALLALFELAHLLDPLRELAQVAFGGTLVRVHGLVGRDGLVGVVAALGALGPGWQGTLDGQGHPVVVGRCIDPFD